MEFIKETRVATRKWYLERNRVEEVEEEEETGRTGEKREGEQKM